jgi:hypothetical protein
VRLCHNRRPPLARLEVKSICNPAPLCACHFVARKLNMGAIDKPAATEQEFLSVKSIKQHPVRQLGVRAIVKKLHAGERATAAGTEAVQL